MKHSYQYLKGHTIICRVASMLLCVLILSSCEKYVDIKKSSNQALIETASDCQLLLDNYGVMNTGFPSDGEASADDYYLTDDGYLSSSLTQTDRDRHTWAPSGIRPGAAQWVNPYKTVYYANLVLETVEELKSKGSADVTVLNNLRGAALFFRSFCFWQIAQLYAKPYSAASAEQDPGIPLRLSSDINDKSERGTVAQTYARIVQDLQEAVSLLQPTSTVPTRPNKAAAYAMLARTYLSMEDYAQAQASADASLQINNQLIDYNTLDVNSYTPFFPRFNKEVLFHSLMEQQPALNPNDIAKINLDLVNTYSANDLRRSIFLKPNSGDNTGSYRFTGNYEPATSALFFNGLAVDEMYLIRAEGYARAGNVTASMGDLNTLLRTRWKIGTYVDMAAVDGTDALNKVVAERRKELLMRGLRWTDLRRLNKDTRFARTLSRSAQETTYTLPPNDIRYTLLIPQEVINNSQISQNPR
ncbi:RagB/SusD family nutrient uptake outer membrane protein [Pedobacter sp. MR2016-24]|uniref:RagB/SusD family nutrient uptake outer membrane protein n=1 Tax=Pedobacter sp. MR2016-24 TaxID=2994466 RepID=UPI00224710AA|nr:RagB/SusD family nutrient uptake outer membrane protein [Pedobacter sp. MR2016-24]MCX2486792.1 RagB/SusD family nutrient uptake outer membrane protein [Pedobacter sp. MR2016-24]